MNSIIYFVKDYYPIMIIWVVITLAITGLVNSCNKREIRRLESIVKIDKEYHTKEVKILKDTHDKQLQAVIDIRDKYDVEIKKVTEQYRDNLQTIKEQQGVVYDKYLKNQELMSQMLTKYFGIKLRR